MHVYLLNLKMVWCQHTRLFMNHLKKHLSSIDPSHNFIAKKKFLSHDFLLVIGLQFCFLYMYMISAFRYLHFWGTSNQGSFLTDGNIQGLQIISSSWHVSWISLAYISNDWLVNIGKPVKIPLELIRLNHDVINFVCAS